MNHLLIGAADTDRLLQLTDFKKPFLLIDDGPIADAFIEHLPRYRKSFVLDWSQDSFNPLTEREYFYDVLPHIFPRTNTLTRDDADYLWLNILAVLDHDTTLLDVRELLANRTVTTRDKFLKENWADIFDWDQKRYDAAVGQVTKQIGTLLINTTMRRILTRTRSTFAANKIVIAKIDRAQWGEFKSFALASLLIGQAQGQVIIPDLGFYGRDFHATLVRQNRLTAAVTSLDELPEKLRAVVLTVKDKTAYRTNLKDAEALVPYFKQITKPSQITDLEDGECLTVAP